MRTLEDIKSTLSLHRKDISEEFRFISLEEYLERLLRVGERYRILRVEHE